MIRYFVKEYILVFNCLNNGSEFKSSVIIVFAFNFFGNKGFDLVSISSLINVRHVTSI